MSNTLSNAPYAPDVRGVLGARIGAFCIDFVVIGILWLIFAAALIVLGFLTFGLSWLLLAPLFPIVALLYNGVAQAVMMATPQDLADFAIGFSLTEGIVATAGECELIEQRDGGSGIELHLAGPCAIASSDLREMRQRFQFPSQCAQAIDRGVRAQCNREF